MDRFSEAYGMARTVLAAQKFSDDWEKFLKSDVDLLGLLGADGPRSLRADGLDKVRAKIAGTTRHGAFVAMFVGGGVADAILAAARQDVSGGSVADRAATIKFLKHLYFSRKRGGQDVWVYAGPKSYSQWVFDEIKGNESSFKAKLGAEAEVYSESDRGKMCDALQLAMAWAQKAAASIASKDEKAQKAVRAWFADASTTNDQIDGAMSKLNDGLKKIAGVCNSGRIVFSDHPPDRSGGGWRDWAFVYRSEAMDVIYMQGAFLKAARSTGSLWKAALTIIHELSHREVNTDDNRYDYDGLKPNAKTFPHAKAITNADSWAYFTLDLVGMLPEGDRNSVLA